MKAVFLLLLGLFFNASLMAALPFAVDGQPLPSLAPMLKQVTPAVVNISTRGKQSTHFQASLKQHLNTLPNRAQDKLSNSLGSGVIINANTGYILTNNHVIDGALEITVTLKDGRELYAELIGRDPDTDIAVIKIKPGDLKQLPFADSSQLQVGDFVVAIGNPFGLGQTVTSGIVSALGRSGLGIESYEDFIQTDAAINLGSSGGALVNLKGELVGINTAILGAAVNQHGSIGIGFAIPINMVNDIMRQLINFGEIKRGRLGVQAQDLSLALAAKLKLKKSQRGVVVTQIEIESSAYHAGLKIADVIIQANGQLIKTTSDVHNLVGLLRINQRVNLKILREGKPMAISIQVLEGNLPTVLGQALHSRLYGIVFEATKKLDMQQGQLNQVFVKSLKRGSQAWLLGFQQGDEIVAINRRRVTHLEGLKQAFKITNNEVLISVKRGNQALHVWIK